MSNGQVTADDLLGSGGPSGPVTADQLLGPDPDPKSGQGWDAYFSQAAKTSAHVLNLFAQGSLDAWGAQNPEFEPEVQQELKASDGYKQYLDDRSAILKGANDAFMRPLAMQWDGLTSDIRDTQQGAFATLSKDYDAAQKSSEEAAGTPQNPIPWAQVALDLGNYGIALTGAYGYGRYFLGTPTREAATKAGASPRVAEALGATAEQVPFLLPLPLHAGATTELAKARALGVIGEGEEGFHESVPLSAANREKRAAAAETAGIEPAPGPVAALPIIDRGAIDLAARESQVNSDIAAMNERLSAMPEGDQVAAEKLARLQSVENQLATPELEAADRKALQTRRDELLTDTTPEALQAAAAPIEERRNLQNQIDASQRELDAIHAQQAQAQAQGILPEGTNVSMKTNVPQDKTAPTPREIAEAYQAQQEAQGASVQPVPGAATPEGEAVSEVPRGGYEGTAGKGAPRGGLKPIIGTGEAATRGLSEGVEASAIEKGLTESFGDLPEYRQVSMGDQAAQAAKLLEKDPEGAKAVAMGQKAPPKGLLPESVFVAVEKRALAEGDVETLRGLATGSRLATEATTMGQRIRTLAERDQTSPVGAIREVQDARAAVLKKRTGQDVEAAKASTVNEIRRTIRKAASKPAWEDFVRSIQCEE